MQQQQQQQQGLWSREWRTPSAGTGLVVRAWIQLFRPFSARLKVVATLSPCASLAVPLFRPVGKLAQEILTACRPGLPS